MNLIGKILIMLILVMSVFFMAIACAVYATHRHWEDVASQLNTQLRTLTDENRKLTNEIDSSKNSLQLEKAARRESIAVLEQRASQYRERLVAKEQQLADLQSQHRQAIETVSNYQKNLTRLKEEVDALRQDTRLTQKERDEAITRVANLTDKVHQGEGMVELLRAQNKQLAIDHGQATLQLDRHGLSKDDPIDNIPPQVNGQITAIRGAKSIEISIGSDEGLRKGHRLSVYSLDRGYLGDVVVETTRPDRAVGRIIPETRRGNIREGDRVATKIL